MDQISQLLTFVVPFLLILTVVVFVHEYGHYWVARRNGVRIETFSVGFGQELFGKTDKHGTRWKFSAIPLGGYVKMLGDADAASATVDAEAARETDSFPAKSVWQRMAIVVAGPAANFIFAILAMTILFSVSGRPFTPAEIGEVLPDSPAAEAQLLPGDRITAVDGVDVESFQDLQGIVQTRPDNELVFTLDRDGATLDVPITPALETIEDRFGNEHRVGLIGIRPAGMAITEYRRSNPVTALGEATAETGRMIVGTLKALGEIIVGSRGTEELGGPLRIAQMSGEVAKDGLMPAIYFTAILSINLGLINLFPIPMLDGGHLVLYTIEAARGRPLTERSQEIAFRVGLAMVLSLMVLATWNDLVQLNVIEFFTGLVS